MQLLISRSSSTLFLIYLYWIQCYITYYLTNWIFLLAAFIYQVSVSIEITNRGVLAHSTKLLDLIKNGGRIH